MRRLVNRIAFALWLVVGLCGSVFAAQARVDAYYGGVKFDSAVSLEGFHRASSGGMDAAGLSFCGPAIGFNLQPVVGFDYFWNRFGSDFYMDEDTSILSFGINRSFKVEDAAIVVSGSLAHVRDTYHITLDADYMANHRFDSWGLLAGVEIRTKFAGPVGLRMVYRILVRKQPEAKPFQAGSGTYRLQTRGVDHLLAAGISVRIGGV